MPDLLFLSKISLPILRRTLVPRATVLRQLNTGLHDDRHILTLVSAPAGYGKTTTIRMWAEEAGYPVAWVTLEKSDNELKQFLTYFLAALQQIRDDLGQDARNLVEAREIDLQRISWLFINDLYRLKQRIILILEDYHLIENERIDQFIELLLNQAVANLHIVITTREDPNLPLIRLRVRGQLTEIRAADLGFSLEEAGVFFSHVMGVSLSTREIEILERRTEGWVAGLQLAALSLKISGNPARFVEAFGGTHRHVLDYLLEEVLKSQPEEIREFLFQTSILDQLSPALCEAVTDQHASREYLQYLETNNLFLISLDEERTWYRYHALFGELLKNQLLQTKPHHVDDLHGRAADWYQQHGLIQKAVEHAFQISNKSKASKLIEQHSLPMLYQGEVSTVAGWFDRLPDAAIQTSPMIWICKAWSLALMYQHTRMEAIEQAIQAAIDALDRTHADDVVGNLVAGHSASIQAYLMQESVWAGEKPETLIETSQKAQQLLPEHERAIRSVNALNIGYGYVALANLPAAEQAYKQAFEDGVVGGNWYAAVYGQIDLIVISTLKGQLNDALHACQANIERFSRLLAGQRFPPIGELYNLRGTILLEEDRLAEAEQSLVQGLTLIQLIGEYEAHLRGYAALARLRSLQGDRMAMLESLRRLEEIRPESAIYAQALRHRLSLHDRSLAKTSVEEAHFWLAQVKVRFDALPDITSVGPMNRVQFQTYLSLAHILTRLALQNSQAYPFQDIHAYFARQERFARAHGLFGWLIEIWIVRALLFQVTGKAKEAHRMLHGALEAAAPRGYFRVFVDEGDLLYPLLESAAPHLKDTTLATFVKRLLNAMRGPSTPSEASTTRDELLSTRELEVLQQLAAGKSYKEIGQQLFLSVNTVQFHIKGIYRKLSVNRRMQAIEKAQQMKLI